MAMCFGALVDGSRGIGIANSSKNTARSIVCAIVMTVTSTTGVSSTVLPTARIATGIATCSPWYAGTADCACAVVARRTGSDRWWSHQEHTWESYRGVRKSPWNRGLDHGISCLSLERLIGALPSPNARTPRIAEDNKNCASSEASKWPASVSLQVRYFVQMGTRSL